MAKKMSSEMTTICAMTLRVTLMRPFYTRTCVGRWNLTANDVFYQESFPVCLSACLPACLSICARLQKRMNRQTDRSTSPDKFFFFSESWEENPVLKRLSLSVHYYMRTCTTSCTGWLASWISSYSSKGLLSILSKLLRYVLHAYMYTCTRVHTMPFHFPSDIITRFLDFFFLPFSSQNPRPTNRHTYVHEHACVRSFLISGCVRKDF